MKKYLLAIALFIVAFSSCKKSDSGAAAAAQAATDDAAIQLYFKANNITTAIKDPSGLYYQITTPGTGPYPTASSNISVAYTGQLLNGTVFDTQPSHSFSLASGVIAGWQIGIPHINKGGTIVLFIPSALAYGTTGSGLIPANSVIMFTITLQGFN